jgi:hypothetical protein
MGLKNKTMSNKQMTAVEEAIQLIKQDYEANGRLRLAYVLQTLNKAKEMEKKQIIDSWYDGALYWDSFKDAEQYYTETYGGQSNKR